MLVFMLLMGCMDKEEEPSLEDSSTVEDTQVEVVLDGAALYQEHCVPCHGEDARGVSNMGPDLMISLEQDDAYFVDVIRNGKGTMFPIEVSQEEALVIVEHIRSLLAN